MTLPNFDPEPGFPQTHKAAAAIRHAIETTRPGKIVFLSTVGAHVAEPNLLNNSKITEEMLRATSSRLLYCVLLVHGKAAWDVEAARKGVIPSFLQPLDHRIPMVPRATSREPRQNSLMKHGWESVLLNSKVRGATPRMILSRVLARTGASGAG